MVKLSAAATKAHTLIDAKLNKSRLEYGVEPTQRKHQLHSGVNQETLTKRRDIVRLYESNTAEDNVYLDRVMIAMHNYQVGHGKVYYRRICGMHGGGGGAPSKPDEPDFEALLKEKMDKDWKQINHSGEKPGIDWPDLTPNTMSPEHYKVRDTPFVYTFCWHGFPSFIVWHRPLMREFERGLQMYDPNFDKYEKDEKGVQRFFGPDALGAPYFAWETWNGLNFPAVIGNEQYIIRTDEYKDRGFKKGDVIPNPYNRYLAPVDVKRQIAEDFPSIEDNNCSTRDPAFKDHTKHFAYDWPIKTNDPERDPTIEDSCRRAVDNPNFLQFGTTNPAGGGKPQFSIESPHNSFHVHCGGYTRDGTTGKTISGTMTTLQSTFDPLFWLHHCNVERQFCSWQQYHFTQGEASTGEVSLKPIDPNAGSVPGNEYLDLVLYPWTKPEGLKDGNYSWNTESNEKTDGTFRDWFFAELHYEYEEYLDGISFVDSFDQSTDVTLNIKFAQRDLIGHFELYWHGKKISQAVSLNGFGKGCGRCETKEPVLAFDVSYLFRDSSKSKMKKNLAKGLSVTRSDGRELTIDAMYFVVNGVRE